MNDTKAAADPPIIASEPKWNKKCQCWSMH